MLPLGTRPLEEIRREDDPVNRVLHAATLLEFLLRNIDPATTNSDGKPIMLGQRVDRNQRLFADVGGVLFALRIRNDIVHSRDRDQPLDQYEIDRAGALLIDAIEEVLPAVPHHVHGAVTSGRSATGRFRFASRKAVLALAIGIAVLALWFTAGGRLPIVSAAVYADDARQALAEAGASMRDTARISGGQGMQALKDRLDAAYTAMREKVDSGHYREGLDAASEIEELCKQLRERDALRHTAAGALAKCDRARTAAQREQAHELRAPSWAVAEDLRTRAKKGFEAGAFEDAGALAERAERAFAAATEEAKMAELAAERKAAFASLVGEIGAARLDRDGGQAWRDANDAAKAADSHTTVGEHEQAATAYARALALLRQVISPVLLHAIDKEAGPEAKLKILLTLLRLEPEDTEARALFNEIARRRARWWASQALARLDNEDEPDARAARASALGAVAVALHRLGDRQTYSEVLARAFELVRRVESSTELAELARDLAWDCLSVGDLARAREMAETGDRAMAGFTGRDRTYGLAESAVLHYALGNDDTWSHHLANVARDRTFGPLSTAQAYADIGDFKHAAAYAHRCGRWQALAFARVAMNAAFYGEPATLAECRRLCMDNLERDRRLKPAAFAALATADALRGRVEDATRLFADVREDRYRDDPAEAIAVALARRGDLTATRAAIDNVPGARTRFRTTAEAACQLAKQQSVDLFGLYVWANSLDRASLATAVLAGVARGLARTPESSHDEPPAARRRPTLTKRRAQRSAEIATFFAELLPHVDVGVAYTGSTVHGSSHTRIEIEFTKLDAATNTIEGVATWTRSDGAGVVHGFEAEVSRGRILFRENKDLGSGGGWTFLTYDLQVSADGSQLVGTWAGSGQTNRPMTVDLR